jgi:hypothetical protein
MVASVWLIARVRDAFARVALERVLERRVVRDRRVVDWALAAFVRAAGFLAVFARELLRLDLARGLEAVLGLVLTVGIEGSPLLSLVRERMYVSKTPRWRRRTHVCNPLLQDCYTSRVIPRVKAR